MRPGSYKVIVLAGDDVIAAGEWFELESGAEVDTGTIVTEPGDAIRVRLERTATGEGVYANAFLHPTDTTHSRSLWFGKSSEHLRVSIWWSTFCAGPGMGS